jgi:Bacterial Ig domain
MRRLSALILTKVFRRRPQTIRRVSPPPRKHTTRLGVELCEQRNPPDNLAGSLFTPALGDLALFAADSIGPVDSSVSTSPDSTFAALNSGDSLPPLNVSVEPPTATGGTTTSLLTAPTSSSGDVQLVSNLPDPFADLSTAGIPAGEASTAGIPAGTTNTGTNAGGTIATPAAEASTGTNAGGTAAAADYSYTYTPPGGDGMRDAEMLTGSGSSSSGSPVVAVSDFASTAPNGSVTINVLSNDSGYVGGPTAVGAAMHGTASISGTQIVYTPTSGYTGWDSFTYTITNGQGQFSTAGVRVSVGSSSNTLIAVDDTAGTLANVSVTINVLSNDLGYVGGPTAVGGAQHGTASISGTQVVYTPTSGYTGSDSFTYTITNGQGQFSTATVTVGVSSSSNALIAVDDMAGTHPNTSITINVLSNDTGYVGGPTAVGAAQNGTASISGTQILYTPSSGYAGPDSFTYTITDGQGHYSTATVSVNISSSSNSLIAVEDTTSTPENTSVTIDVLSNDQGYVGGPSTAGGPVHGTTDYSGTQVVYTPPPGYTGSDVFTYTITDGQGHYSSARVWVTIGSIIEPPPPPIVSISSVPDDTAAEPWDDTAFFVLSRTGDTSQSLEVQLQLGGTADATSDYTLAADNHQVEGGVVSFQSGEAAVTVLLTPTDDFVSEGTESVAVQVVPNGSQYSVGDPSSATLSILDDELQANDDAAFTPADTSVTIDVLANDTGYSGGATVLDGPANGSITMSGSQIIYTPEAGYTGVDSFTYQIADEAGDTASATVTVIVYPISSSVVGVESVEPIVEDQTDSPISVTFSVSRSGGDSGPLSVSYTATLSAGEFVDGGSNVSGAVNFESGATSADVTLLVSPLNDPDTAWRYVRLELQPPETGQYQIDPQRAVAETLLVLAAAPAPKPLQVNLANRGTVTFSVTPFEGDLRATAVAVDTGFVCFLPIVLFDPKQGWYTVPLKSYKGDVGVTLQNEIKFKAPIKLRLFYGVEAKGNFQEAGVQPQDKSGNYYWAQYIKYTAETKPAAASAKFDTPLEGTGTPPDGKWHLDGKEGLKEGMPHYYGSQELLGDHPYFDAPGSYSNIPIDQDPSKNFGFNEFADGSGKVYLVEAVKSVADVKAGVVAQLKEDWGENFRHVDVFEFQTYLVDGKTGKPVGYASWGFTVTTDLAKGLYKAITVNGPKWNDGQDNNVWGK